MKLEIEQRIRRRTLEDFYRLWSEWRPKLKRLPSVWATEERRIASGQSPLTRGEDIRYSHDVMPHAVEPMDEADNPDVSIIVLWMGRRMGKTESICGNVIGRTVTDDPGLIYSMWPVEDSSDRFGRDVIEPMITATPALNGVFVEKKSRDSGRTVDFKKYHGGSIYIVNAGSRSKTRGMAAKVVLLHEIDAYPVSSGGEGDPISKALGRAEGFGDAIKILESTGTFTSTFDPDGKEHYRSNVKLWFDRSDQRKWFCPCRKCGQRQWLKFEQITAIIRKSGSIHFYLCEFCEADHNETQWRRMVSNGKWKPTAPFVNGVRGYWINQFCSLLPTGKGFKSKLHQFHAEGLRALNGTPEERQVWINEVKAELWNPEAEANEPPPPWKPIFDGREDYATTERITVPRRALVLTCMTDLHSNRLELEWRAWARTAESWGLAHVVLDGDTNDMDVWDRWTRELARTFTRVDGAALRLSLAFVDGGWRPDPVLAILRKLSLIPVPGVSGKIRITKGVGAHGMPIMGRRWQTIKGNAKGYHIGIWGAKRWIYDRLAWHGSAEKPSAEFIHFGQNYSEEAIRQTVSEIPIKEIERGVEVEKFINPEGNRNEILDLLVGNLAAFRRHDWNFDTIEAELLETTNPKPKPREEPEMVVLAGQGWDL